MKLAEQHSIRFRAVSNRYPRRVAEAYEGDIAKAMVDSDRQVAARVRLWEKAHGIRPRDWERIGWTEGREVNE